MLSEPHISFIEVVTTKGDNPHKLALYEWGGGCGEDREIVFCIHGLTRNGRDFDTLASALSEKYRVISIDMAGRGKSDYYSDPSLYNYTEYVSDIIQVLKKLQITKLHLVGTSMGGIIGMMLANFSPESVKTLILNDIGCFIPAAGLKRIMEYAGSRVYFSSIPEAEEELRRRCVAFGIKNEEDWQRLFKHGIKQDLEGRIQFAYDPAVTSGIKNTSEEIQDVDLWKLWGAVKNLPVLLIRGTQSDILTHETAVAMQNSHPDLTLLEIADAGHAPALLDEYQVGAINNWLEKNTVLHKKSWIKRILQAIRKNLALLAWRNR